MTLEINYFAIVNVLCLGVLRVITRPEIDPTRSKETKIPDPYPTRNFEGSLDPTRPVPEILRADPKLICF